MSGAIAGGLPILAVSAPFLVVAVLMIPAARSWGLRLMPWATLPALLVALLGPDGASQLPGTLLGSTLVLGETTRLALITTALLWLAASLATSLA
ncbi:MAG: NADH-ubiquinone oxidoreductase, partial [Chromatiaceae bacterium]|nr:NADH-ubiquinone oxidoreductase [Candidatus Thioaporhodococcus sediminis]